MAQDIDIKKMRTNCFRQSKVRGEFMLQMRVPAGYVEARHLSLIQDLAAKYGNGYFHLGSRQTFSIPGIKYDSIPAVNAFIAKYLEEIEVEMCGIDMDTSHGYPTIGARNTMGCIGAVHCPKANANTQDMAKKLEKLIFPSHYHIKISVAGCPNDCAKGHFNDFGIIGLTKPEYDIDRCIGCGKCEEACAHHATRVLSLVNGKIQKDACCCVGCGECVLACPTGAWSRSVRKFYRILIGGRSGKQFPRMGKTFVDFVTEDVVLAILSNWQEFSATVMNHKPEYIHGGHLMDRGGYVMFKDMMLKDVALNQEARVAEEIYFAETEYRGRIHVKPAK